MHEKIERWLEWIHIIEEEVRGLRIQSHIFHEVRKIVEANPALHKPSSFYDWMRAVYASSCSVGIRRQADNSRDVVSLARLLREIENDGRLLHRERFLSLYEGSGVPDRIANGDFDRLAGEGASHYSGSLARGDQQRLQEAASKIRDYVNQRVAHPGLDDPQEVPTFRDLDQALDMLEELVIKYARLLRGFADNRLLPTWQYDWKAIFRTPWIPAEESNAGN